MTTSTISRSLRIALVTTALALATTVGAVSADVLVPAHDSGGPGGGSTNAGYVGQTQNQRSIALIEGTLVQNALVAAEQAPQATSPNQAAF
jgi:hypothetical protein